MPVTYTFELRGKRYEKTFYGSPRDIAAAVNVETQRIAGENIADAMSAVTHGLPLVWPAMEATGECWLIAFAHNMLPEHVASNEAAVAWVRRERNGWYSRFGVGSGWAKYADWLMAGADPTILPVTSPLPAEWLHKYGFWGCSAEEARAIALEIRDSGKRYPWVK